MTVAALVTRAAARNPSDLEARRKQAPGQNNYGGRLIHVGVAASPPRERALAIPGGQAMLQSL